MSGKRLIKRFCDWHLRRFRLYRPLSSTILSVAAARFHSPIQRQSVVHQDLQQAVRERQKAIESADATTWDRMTSGEFTLVAANGHLSTKAERLAALKQQNPQTSASPRSQEQIRVYGNSAIERVRSGDVWVIQVW